MARKRVLYPSVQQPVFTPVTITTPTWFETHTRQVWPRKVAQQPNAYAAPVMDPSLFTPPAFSECTSVIQFRSKRAQQPDAYCAPVMVIAAPVVTGTSYAVIF